MPVAFDEHPLTVGRREALTQQIKVIVVELAARARDRAGEAGHERRFAGEEHVALVERLIDKITIPISVCSPRARGDLASGMGHASYTISIHSPHVRGDPPSFFPYL